MFLRNFDNMAIYATNLNAPYTNQQFADGYLSVKWYNGNMENIQYNGNHPFKYSWRDVNSTVNNASNTNLMNIGSGTNAVTYDDYTITYWSTSEIIPSTHTIGDLTYDDTTGSWIKTVSRDYKNVTSDTIIVTEVGVYQNGILWFRQLLDTPVEVPVNMYITINFTYGVAGNPNKPTVQANVHN